MRDFEEQLEWEYGQIETISKLSNKELRLFAFALAEEQNELEQVMELVSQETAKRHLKIA